MSTKLKNLIKYILFFIINLLISSSKKIESNSLLFIRLDAIGDYVLFRNYIEVLKKSEKYKNYSITLVGNTVWKSLSEELDSEYIDRFIWIDRKSFFNDFFYRYQKLKEITSQGYDIILNSVYSREFLYGDNIVKLVNANEKIGSVGDYSNINKWQKNISDKYYTKLIEAENEIMFEFDRNREFFENFLETKINITKHYIKLKEKKLAFEFSSNCVILFIGANDSFRKWSIKRFAKIAMWLQEKYKYQIVLCGASSDIIESKEFAKYFKGKYLDLVGKTSLLELLFVISKGDLIISNETSAPHFAVALDIKNTFVISNGNHYGRFTPYPKSITSNYHVIYHPKIEKNLNDYKKLSNSYGYGSHLNINDITIDMVKNKIEEILNETKSKRD